MTTQLVVRVRGYLLESSEQLGYAELNAPQAVPEPDLEDFLSRIVTAQESIKAALELLDQSPENQGSAALER